MSSAGLLAVSPPVYRSQRSDTVVPWMNGVAADSTKHWLVWEPRLVVCRNGIASSRANISRQAGANEDGSVMWMVSNHVLAQGAQCLAGIEMSKSCEHALIDMSTPSPRH